MNKYLVKLRNLISKSGLILFFLRLPSRVIKILLIRLNSFFWKLFLNHCGKNVTIELGVNFGIPKNISIGDNVYIGCNTSFGSELNSSTIIIENNVHIGRHNKIDFTGNIIIKENTLFSENIVILTHSHGYNPKNKPIPKPLIIETNCWLGLNTIVTENCNFIAKSTIVATGSILTKDVNEINLIMAGIPAKKIKSFK